MQAEVEIKLKQHFEAILQSTYISPAPITNIVNLLEEGMPSEIAQLRRLDDVQVQDALDHWIVARLAGADKNKDRHRTICRSFISLVLLLLRDVEKLETVPEWMEIASIVQETKKRTLNLERQSVDVCIEVALANLGHYHEDGSKRGKMHSGDSQEAYTAVSLLWDNPQPAMQWICYYLSFRLMRNLLSVHIFFAMHGQLPQQREFKILVYLIMLVSRNELAPNAQFADLCHELGYGILTECKRVFQAEPDLEKLAGEVKQLLSDSRGHLDKISEKIADGKNDTNSLSLRVTRTFFRHYHTELMHAGGFHVLLWSLPMYREVRESFQSIANYGSRGQSLLLIGETGTGKESIAQLFLKSFGHQPVKINCAGRSWTNISLELFGDGKERASVLDGSTALFLDEIDKAPLDTQGGLLGLLDKPAGEYYLPGEKEPRRWTGLIIGAATDLLLPRIREGNFLADLYWRFDMRAQIIPLRNTTLDSTYFRTLFGYALGMASGRFRLAKELTISDKHYRLLERYSWPGNLRELLQLADAFAMAAKSAIPKEDKTGQELAQLSEELFEKVFNRFKALGANLIPNSQICTL